MTMIRSYDDCARLAKTKKRKLENNTYLDIIPGMGEANPTYAVRFHATRIVVYYENGDVVLNSGGWRTMSTKARINEFSPLQVWQANGLWTVAWRDIRVPFADGITFNVITKEVSGAGEDPKAEVKLRRKVNAYATGFVKALTAGEVGRPSMGDCWFCLMKDQNGKTIGDDSTDHLLAHIEEKYYVPSLLVNAMKDWSGQCTSNVARWYAHAAMDGEPPVAYWGHIAEAQLHKVIFDYMAHRLGLTPGRVTYRRAA